MTGAANIGPRGRRRRLVMGAGMLVLGSALLGGLLLTGSSAWLRLTVFIPFWAAGLGLFQARAHT